MGHERECLQPVSVTRRQSFQHLIRYSGISFGSVRFMQEVCWGHIQFSCIQEVEQGCVLAPALFRSCMDWALRKEA